MVYGLHGINVKFLILRVTYRRLPLFVGNTYYFGVIGHRVCNILSKEKEWKGNVIKLTIGTLVKGIEEVFALFFKHFFW